MLLLNPRSVTFGSATWDSVVAVMIDRDSVRFVEEWSDAGPHAVLADAPEQRVTIRVVQEVTRDDLGSPRPGEAGALSLCTAPTGADAGRRKLTAQAVVRSVSHEVSLKRGAVRTITLVAVSADGAADPIAIADA